MPSAPTTEIGSTNTLGNLPWGLFQADTEEYVPELVWPRSVQTYGQMRTDAQVHALWQAATLPIRRYKWMLDPNGARDEVVAAISEDFGLPIKGQEVKPKRRNRRRFSHDHHLYHALLALAYGHSFMEQVGEIVDGKWRLRKLAPRMPSTIAEIQIATDGGLKGIKQMLGLDQPEIPINRLIAYVWEREGGNWTGRSMFRPLYKSWVIKDRLVRVDAIKQQRYGAPTPVATGSPDMQGKQLEELGKLAQAVKVGEEGGAAMPYGTRLDILGVSGSAPDTIASVRYHDEQMARAFLAMFIQLGQTATGSRALGSEFIDYFALAQESIAIWYADTTNEHGIEDYVDWNWGEEELAPLLCWERDEDPELSVADLVALLNSKAIVVDEDLEHELRERYNLPEKVEPPEGSPPVPNNVVPPPSPEVEVESPPKPPVEAGRRRAVRAADASSPLKLPDRPLRRQPYTQEVLAEVDYEQLDRQWTSALDDLLSKWEGVTKAQAAELRTVIAATSDLTKLAQVQASPAGADLLMSKMEQLAKDGATAARAEAIAQGRTVGMPNLDDVMGRLEARAGAIETLLSRSLSETAGRQAVARSGGALSADAVAEAVENHLLGLSGNWLRDQLAGALTQALNSGRKEVMVENKPTSLYASELLDEATCEECTAIDGTEYGDVEEAEADYPTGGYSECLGGPRCRGTLVALYEDEAEPSA